MKTFAITKWIYIAVFFQIFVCTLTYSQNQSKTQVHLHLVLNGGFLNLEPIKIKVQYSTGDSLIYAGKLLRPMWTLDHNSFLIPLEKGKVNIVSVECVFRGVTFEHGFRYVGQDVYFDLSINMRNQFYGFSSDEVGTYD